MSMIAFEVGQDALCRNHGSHIGGRLVVGQAILLINVSNAAAIYVILEQLACFNQAFHIGHFRLFKPL